MKEVLYAVRCLKSNEDMVARWSDLNHSVSMWKCWFGRDGTKNNRGIQD